MNMGPRGYGEILTPIFARSNDAGQTALLNRYLILAILAGVFVLNVLYFGIHRGRLCLLDAGGCPYCQGWLGLIPLVFK